MATVVSTVVETTTILPRHPNPITALRMIPVPRCTVCGIPSLFSCALCEKGPSYCGPLHFLTDWPHHSQRCSPTLLRTWEEALVQADAHRESERLLAMLLKPEPEDGPNPEETVCTVTALLAHPEMVRLVRPATGARSGHLVPALEEYFPHPCARTLIQFGQGMRFLKSPFHVYYCLESYHTNSFPNRAIGSLTKNVQPVPRPWPGTVLVLKMTDSWNRATPAEVNETQSVAHLSRTEERLRKEGSERDRKCDAGNADDISTEVPPVRVGLEASRPFKI
ncbi:hypothetical protein C8Q76DRAFT_697920 [Earliella scabrosa]|nr:hypothetical protein C8Q76DRAFT_697920 [Earliella scabrosa]